MSVTADETRALAPSELQPDAAADRAAEQLAKSLAASKATVAVPLASLPAESRAANYIHLKVR